MMFSLEELRAVLEHPTFKEDMKIVSQSLVNKRLGRPLLRCSDGGSQLSHFAEAVLAAAPDWPSDARFAACSAAAEISEYLAAGYSEPTLKRRMNIRAALLYELSALPALTESVLEEDDLTGVLDSFFRRRGPFAKLKDSTAPDVEDDIPQLLAGELALLDDALSYAIAVQKNNRTALDELRLRSVSSVAWRIGAVYDLGLSASEMKAFATILCERAHRSTLESVDLSLIPSLRLMEFPTELLPAQRAAIDGGLLDARIPAWGFAAPTGSGKTFLARLLITQTLATSHEGRIIYLVPSKALVSEIAEALDKSLGPLTYKVLALSAQLVDLEDYEKAELDVASVVVMTPEKADLLLRLGARFLEAVVLTVVDEAHHIESGTRGALLELYLWRLKRVLPSQCRFVFLSAVAPNIGDITHWLAPNGSAVTYARRPTRMRVGIYRLVGTGVSTRGMIAFADGTSVDVVSSRAETGMRRGICQLAEFLQTAGPVLIVAKGKSECEHIALEIKNWLSERGHLSVLTQGELATNPYKSLDASLEREMYPEVAMRDLIKCRIAYHHAGLPPNVRHGVEKAIRDRLIDYVVATTTLAEGVNFPFSSVIVQSLALKEPPEEGRPSRYVPVTPRTFWNIAGRAGRPGFDSEGQVVLFEPSLGLDKINAVIDPYLQPEITSMAPVKSALAMALEEIEEDLRRDSYNISDLQQVSLPSTLSRRARGAINLLRVGLVHARATGLINSPEEIIESSFAARFLSDESLEFAKLLLVSQNRAMDEYVAGGDEVEMRKLAELGLSLETLNNLRDYVHRMEDWQITHLEKLFYGGTLNLNQAQYIIGPVAKRMSELEGPALGGFLSDVIVRWLSGVTFTSIRSQAKFSSRLEDLVAVIYSRVQYLLPWGLWATDWLIEREASRREINYDNQVRKLAYLADSGVPNFDAAHLTHTGFERVDATRLSNAYTKAGGVSTGLDCIGWVLGQPPQVLERVIRGSDNRRLEHRFLERIEALRGRTSEE